MEFSGTRLGLNGRAAHETGGAVVPIAGCGGVSPPAAAPGGAPGKPAGGDARATAGFTMIEIAICLAIIGFALVAIIGALPLGLRIQRDNRQQTIVNQDATVFLQAISRGARGVDDLTNYVYAITNYWTRYDANGRVIGGGGGINNGYTFTGASVAPGYVSSGIPINSGARIIGLLSTPEYMDDSGVPVPNLYGGGYSNHVVAYVYSISGPAVNKPPQANDSIVRQDSFSYRILCVNAPFPHYLPPLWTGQTYVAGDTVSYILNGQTTYWQAIVAGQPPRPPQSADTPGRSARWARMLYPQELDLNAHELRLTFLWPQLPTGRLPPQPSYATFRTLVAGQLTLTNDNSQALYFYQPQIFASAP